MGIRMADAAGSDVLGSRAVFPLEEECSFALRLQLGQCEHKYLAELPALPISYNEPVES